MVIRVTLTKSNPQSGTRSSEDHLLVRHKLKPNSFWNRRTPSSIKLAFSTAITVVQYAVVIPINYSSFRLLSLTFSFQATQQVNICIKFAHKLARYTHSLTYTHMYVGVDLCLYYGRKFNSEFARQVFEELPMWNLGDGVAVSVSWFVKNRECSVQFSNSRIEET